MKQQGIRHVIHVGVKSRMREIFSLSFICLFLFSQLWAASGSEAILLQKDAADVEVSGKVVDENGMAMPGATVAVEGTSIGVVTDLDGNYTITVDESAILVFSYVGYLSVGENVASRTLINVSLEPDATALDEVVVTGYQTLSKERVTGSFETLTTDVIQMRPTNNFVSRLDGLASGVNVTAGQVEIRGKSTIMGNANPLYVVDGFPLASSTLTVNPEDIESITILKDAAAASIWGVRASNGVIVVTTKKGTKQGIKVDFSAFIEIGEEVDYDKRKWLSTSNEIDLFQEYWDKGWYKGVRGEIGLNYAFSLQEEANIYHTGLSPDGITWTNEEFNAYID
jgi:TonB-dependent SusC/RagA subfamily outer membrane receptor